MLKSRPFSQSEFVSILRYLVRWTPVGVLAGILGGSASALLLWSLVVATDVRESHKWLISLLPLAGLLVGVLYRSFGTSVEAGNNLILDEIHDPKQTIPVRMTPLILMGTFLTHLFGGSAGREGTAIQTGASLADQLAKPFRMNPHERRILLMAGISAGFASVFGTPLAGAIFGMEVLAFGVISYSAIAPCFIAAFIGDLTTSAWGVHHTIYRITDIPIFDVRKIFIAAIAGAVFGLVGKGFAKTTHAIHHRFQEACRLASSAALYRRHPGRSCRIYSRHDEVYRARHPYYCCGFPWATSPLRFRRQVSLYSGDAGSRF